MQILSIQSHVVHGIVGNKAAVFPLMLRGHSVDPLNVCQLSNHTGYGAFRGARLSKIDIEDLVTGLRNIGALTKYRVVITGYVGRADALTAVAALVKELAELPQRPIYLCDPVLGDNGALYVPGDVVPIYHSLLSYADVVTPNGFEALTLSGVDPCTLESAAACCTWFHDAGVRLVVVTSLTGECQESASGSKIVAFASLRNGDAVKQCFAAVPRVEGRFSGTGDLLAALITADASQVLAEGDPTLYLGRWCSTVYGVLRRTFELSEANADEPCVDGFRELALAACVDLLSTGSEAFRALPY